MIHEQREQLAARVRASLGSEQIRYREEEISEASHVGNEVSRGRRDAEQLTRYRITWESREVACGGGRSITFKFKGGSCQPRPKSNSADSGTRIDRKSLSRRRVPGTVSESALN